MEGDFEPGPGTYVTKLANHARTLQTEAHRAFERGDYTRASRLIGDAELLAEDIHDLVAAMERSEMGSLSRLATYDIRPEPEPEPDAAPQPPARRLPFSPRALGLAIGASLAFSFAISEF